MNNYIPADKLIAKIQPYYENAKCKARYAAETGTSSDCAKWDEAEAIYEHILRIISSLQQEQPKLPGYNKALLEVKSKVDELYEETSIGLSEYDSGLYNGIAETCMKLRGFIKARLESDEQPEVDLEEEIKKYCREYYNCNYPDQIQNGNCSPVMPHIVEAARRFWNKGYNAKKEE